jgi:phospholipid N-methyltransferase
MKILKRGITNEEALTNMENINQKFINHCLRLKFDKEQVLDYLDLYLLRHSAEYTYKEFDGL